LSPQTQTRVQKQLQKYTKQKKTSTSVPSATQPQRNEHKKYV